MHFWPKRQRPALLLACRLCRLAAIIITSPREDRLYQAMQQLTASRPHFDGKDLWASNCPIWIFEGKHRARLLISADKSVNIQNILEDWLGPIKLSIIGAGADRHRSLQFSLDCSPVHTTANRQKIVNFPFQTACLSGMAMIATTLHNLLGGGSLIDCECAQ